MKRIVVIGGGASGLCAALSAKEAGADVILLEHNDKLGKKLAATGNGKCNLGNTVLTADCYRGGDPQFVSDVFSECSPEQVRSWLTDRGLYLKEKRGYFYPYSEQAASVITFFASRLADKGVNVIVSAEVLKLKKEKKGFSVTYKNLISDKTVNVSCDRVIVATGGLAGQNLGAGPFGYETAKSFGHVISPLFPALVQMVARDKNLKTLSGVRAEACVTLIAVTDGAEKQYKESGEVLFTDYGISGIAVMQLSRYAGDAIRQKGEASLSIDFLPDFSKDALYESISRRILSDFEITVEDCLSTILPKKLLYVIFLRAGVRADAKNEKLTAKDIRNIVKEMKGFTLPIIQTKDFPMAQVTAGGISVSGIHAATLESKLQKGLYFTGELLDVDGTCGGYNLQFAFATGILAGTAAATK
ncbi:MAG: NAD(P)/FAD-dependent oxidoreductase [Lachnospiraceae bacterium]|nr:NAD(P)/FAD-dependent oxidoreductase [Lachnospiraceae bacterium]